MSEARCELHCLQSWKCFVLVVCLRVFTFHYPVSQSFSAVRSGQGPPLPAPAETYVIMLRHDYIVHLYELSATEYTLLCALMDGPPLCQALHHAQEKTNQLPNSVALLSAWTAKGFFASLRLPSE